MSEIVRDCVREDKASSEDQQPHILHLALISNYVTGSKQLIVLFLPPFAYIPNKIGFIHGKSKVSSKCGIIDTRLLR